MSDTKVDVRHELDALREERARLTYTVPDAVGSALTLGLADTAVSRDVDHHDPTS